MNTKEITQKRICCFYANEIHLEVIIVPYISKKLEKNEKVYLINEENLKYSIKDVINKMPLDEKQKKEILKLQWNNKDNKIEKINKEKDKTVILVSGSEKFNTNINKKILNKNNFEIINCYNLEKTDNIESIKNAYSKVINSTGIKEFI